MNDEDRLREVLSAAVPEPPPNPERVAHARAYAEARRRRTTTAAALGVVAALVAIAVPVGLSRVGSERHDEPAPVTSQSPSVVPGDNACPPSPGPRELLEPDPGPPTIEPGVVAIRLCHPGGFPWQPPADALAEDVGAVVAAVNGLSVQPPPEACTAEGGLTWGMTFQYGDGRARFIEGANYGCGGVRLGTATLGDAREAARVLSLFQTKLRAQRATSEPPPPGDVDLRCQRSDPDRGPGTSLMGLGDPVQLSVAVLCWRFETESEQPAQQAAISDADLATLLDDLNTNRTSREITEQECVDPDVVHYEILGVNAWGDRLSLDGYCGAFDLSGENSDIWRPNAASQAILDRLVSANPTVILDPDDRTPPDQVLSIWADLVNAGERVRADPLWLEPPEIPAGVRVEMKTAAVRSVHPDPGTAEAAYRIVMEVDSLYRLVPADGSWVHYHEVRFTLVRDSIGMPWRIVSMTDLGAVSTGR